MKRVILLLVVASAFFLVMLSNRQESRYACLPPGVHVQDRFVIFQGITGPIHWGHKVVTYAFSINTPEYAKTSFRSGFDQWTLAANGLLTFKATKSIIEKSDIFVVWDEKSSIIPNPLYVGFTILQPDDNSVLTHATIIINEGTYDFHRGKPKGQSGPDANSKLQIDIDAASLHEIGHALGLSHSDLDPAHIVGPPGDIPTMNSFITTGMERLHQDDIAGLLAIYSGRQLTGKTDFDDTVDLMTQLGSRYTSPASLNTPAKLKGKHPKSIQLDRTVLYFDVGGSFIGQLERRRFVPIPQP